jgi:hypothetical protein
VAAANPGKVKEMTDLMFGEFAKHQVLPLDASVATISATISDCQRDIRGVRYRPASGKARRHAPINRSL